ncbi:MASE3 domain-containing protein [Neobacillus sp. YIM B06451]|uniref:MASE3 domain-containing protein n=1 Tax=Neobacillus sp. YIM B06451 TaxID=3070994 RepID=UPI0029304283|nr:MASE3 domain-containing protein [Neobacillus sp. YIM B06451]
MKNTMTEGRFLAWVAGAIITLMGIHVFHPQLVQVYNPVNYVSFHALLEFFSIMISFVIVLYSWRVLGQNRSVRLLLILFIFSTVGMVDLLHTVTFKGMPYFLTESSVAKATCFWIVARMVEAILMLVVMLMPDKLVRRDFRKPVLSAAIMLGLAIMAIVFIFEKSLPVLVIEGQGTTPLKNGLEYFISFLHFLSLVVCLHHYYLEKCTTHLNLALAFTLLFLSEMIFTVYQSVFDLDNFTGHIFKVLGYYFILKGVFLLLKKKEPVPEENAVVKLAPGAVFSFTKKEGRLMFTYMEGGLLRENGLKPSAITGTDVEDLLPPMEGDALDYCHECWETGTKQTFLANFNKRHFAISLVPIAKGGKVEEITGTAVDVSNFVHYGARERPQPAVARKGKALKTL